jgi:hypothetical protein
LIGAPRFGGAAARDEGCVAAVDEGVDSPNMVMVATAQRVIQL